MYQQLAWQITVALTIVLGLVFAFVALNAGKSMPDYVNRLQLVFRKEGTYKVLCMEYCGIAHHNMLAEIRVVASDAAIGGKD